MWTGRKRNRDCLIKNKERTNTESKRRKTISSTNCKVQKLTDVCAKFVAENFPFQHVEESLPQIPEPIQSRIVFWAFPKNEREIALYSSTNCQVLPNDNQKQPFQHGIRLFESGNVFDVLQVGFHLSGTVKETQGICLQRKVFEYKVSLKFDRCKITSVSCTCNNRTILWCSHAVALAIYRIRHAESVQIRLPVSESILQLRSTQLQSLVLHLITKHHQILLPSVQKLLDDLKQPESEINKAAGIPDPTAGACSGSSSFWYLDSDLIQEEIKTGLEPNNTGKNISSLLSKVRELFVSEDGNAVRLLSLITDNFVAFEKKSNDGLSRVTDKVRKLWDNLTSVWVCAALNPRIAVDERKQLQQQLMDWNQEQLVKQNNRQKEPGSADSIFKIPLLALDWQCLPEQDDLVKIAAYADAFRCHGFNNKAVDIAVLVAEKLENTNWGESYEDATEYEDCWLGHILDPINILFDILSGQLDGDNGKEIHISRAVYVAFSGLAKRRALPSDKYKQWQLCHREEQLLAQLEDLDFTNDQLKPILCGFCEYLRHRTNNIYGISPSHSLARFLFNKLLSIDNDLAYKICLPLLVLSAAHERRDADNFIDAEEIETCHIQTHLELQQSELAANLLRGCTNSKENLSLVVNGIKTNLKNPSQLFRMAKLASTMLDDHLLNIDREMKVELLEAAVELGTKAVQLTLTERSADRREMVRWLISSSVMRGKEAVNSLFSEWRTLFMPEEISDDVATMLSSQPVLFKLRMDKEEERNFMSQLRRIVIESAIRDPSSCALFALTMCEDEPDSFDLACQIVSESSSRLSTTELFSIARYLESKNYLNKALKVASVAIKQLDIGLDQEAHPAVSDVFWACALACSLGKDDVTQITPIICNCVRNPVVLAEIARRSVRTSNYFYQNGQTKTKAKLSFSKEPISRILANAQQLFIQEVQNKLDSISPKQYNAFIQYLGKVKSGFQLVDEGNDQFQWLLDYIATSQKGRKKLQKLIRDNLSEKI